MKKKDFENERKDSEYKEMHSEEYIHLEKVEEKIREAVSDAGIAFEKKEAEYSETKHYMANYRGEIDPHEMFQNERLLEQIDRSSNVFTKDKSTLEKLKYSPYFARIDFEMNGDEIPGKYYLGRNSFIHDGDFLIYDWRSPIASLFYEYKVGPAGYDAPMGRINGKLTLKRQFKIQKGKMEYVLESSDNVNDDILGQELSNNSSEKMKAIITTIQAEQNKIIRNENANTLIIHGVAGSGKTSIALHRVAYLLYKHKDDLSSKHMVILSPNKVFGDYISNILPELGEEPICEMSLKDIADVQMEKVAKFESKTHAPENNVKLKERAQYKSTLKFFKALQDYIMKFPDFIIDITGYSVDDFSVSAEWIKYRIQAYSSSPFIERLKKTADDILDKFQTENVMEHELPSKNEILKSLKRMLRFKNTLSLYKNFYKTNDAQDMINVGDGKILEWNDIYPFLYLHHGLYGLKVSKVARHLIIDEMQDYTPVELMVLNKLFNCKKTILGDFGQAVNPCNKSSFHDLQKLYGDAEIVTLNTSYRSTYEIMEFAKKLIGNEHLKPVKRHGEKPDIISCSSDEKQNEKIHEILKKFNENKRSSIGIILKTEEEANLLFSSIKYIENINLINSDSKYFLPGITITSVQMSKGLEFDEVIVPDVDIHTYRSEHDKNLLYVACTRAMHKLTLLYTGKVSTLLPS